MLTQYGEPGNLRTARDYWHLVGPQSPGSASNTRASTLCEPLLRSVWFLSPLRLLSVWFSASRFLLPLHRPAYKLHESEVLLFSLLDSARTDYCTIVLPRRRVRRQNGRIGRSRSPSTDLGYTCPHPPWALGRPLSTREPTDVLNPLDPLDRPPRPIVAKCRRTAIST